MRRALQKGPSSASSQLMPRYDYRCARCPTAVELVLPITSDPAAPRRCPNCKRRTLRRHTTGEGISVCTAAIAYQNRFPYVSTQLPFGAKGAKHVGPLKKLLVENRRHEQTLREMHGYVGENGKT